MEKVVKSSDERSIGYGASHLVSIHKSDQLVGKILTIVEAMGLPEKQENSLKEVVRQEIYRAFENVTFVPGTLNTLIREMVEWGENNTKEDAGVFSSGFVDKERWGFMKGEFELSYKEE